MSWRVSRRRLLAAGMAVTGGAWAQPGWPSRPLRIVVPYGPGGTTDMLARQLVPDLQRLLGQPVHVDYKPGADGNIGSVEVAKATDGHTLLMGTIGTHALNAVLSRRLPYDPMGDFAPVALVAVVPLVLVINPAVAAALGIRTVADLVRVARAQPGRLHLASAGNGTSSHLCGELFKKLTGTEMPHFPYRSAGPAQQDVVAGNMDLMFDSLPSALPQLRAGGLQALALSSARRSPTVPDLPTLEEAGGAALKGFEARAWFGLLAPAHQPPEQLARLQRDTAQVLAQPALRERFTALGAQVGRATPTEFAAFMAAETMRWARIVRQVGVKVDR
ncbi:MAG: MFS transporter [Roseateles depolymerans]|uniref:MFS transporter n=1 Tax=Roseateles depolymerans TaxID=76731 RepID=A0A2W5DHY1_9BURK|nr:MAG: MFS transporter [Roseateles depolymerans]